MNMTNEEIGDVKNSVKRLFFVVVSVILQLIWLAYLMTEVVDISPYISGTLQVIAVVIALFIYAGRRNPDIKLPWIMLILVFPVLGVLMFLLFDASITTYTVRKHIEAIDQQIEPHLKQNEETLNALRKEDPSMSNIATYLYKYASAPLYRYNDVTFYSNASDAIEAQKEALKQAKRFIFMEYHAIEDAQSFAPIKEILAAKVKEGVDVRIFYDDVGSIGFINTDFIERMEELGIRTRVFNKVVPFLSFFMNNRDHRKITVVDGQVGFTGGYNLANEYFNLTHPYGHWKDTGIRIEGSAVQSLTALFLEMWNAIKDDHDNITNFLYMTPHYKSDGFIQPYGDTPLDQETTGEDVYLNIIKRAKHYVYITTPYLITTSDMTRELSLAAKRGVDVKIITPGIPDKKTIYRVTRSYYQNLVRAGVKIYEYTPGFMHAKEIISDGEIATCGTINFDYRSLYHHFENGAVLYKCSCIKDMVEDFKKTLLSCEDVTDKYLHRRGRSIIDIILRLFAPLL